VGWRRRPLLRLVTAGSGGPGQPSAGITTGCPQGLDAAGTKAGGSPPDKGCPKGAPCVPPGSYGAGDRKAAWWSAGRRRALRGAARRGPPEAARRRGEASGCAVRRSTPSHFARGAKVTAYPAPQRIGAAERCLSGFLKTFFVHEAGMDIDPPHPEEPALRCFRASWFETRGQAAALLTMRVDTKRLRNAYRAADAVLR
jgi:hypothetical protein